MDFSAIIAEELKLEVWRVAKALELMDQGGTVPFIARYRKDQTGTLNEISAPARPSLRNSVLNRWPA